MSGVAGRSGRRQTPTALKLLRGNPGKRRLPEDEPKPGAPASAEAPAWLDSEAREFWDTYAPRLIELGLLTELDVELFADACSAHSLMLRAQARVGTKLLKDGRPNPLIRVARDAREQKNRILGQFGFSPATRAKLNVPGKPKVDPFEELLSGRHKA